MKGFLFAVPVMMLFISLSAHGQRVPDDALGFFEKGLSENGRTIENRIFPDFSRVHPTQLFLYTQCYPGKKIGVFAVMPDKPKDWKFKVNAGSSTVTPRQAISEVEIHGKRYYSNTITLEFPSQMSDHSDKCMNIIAYDGDNIDLPVYLYIYSFK